MTQQLMELRERWEEGSQWAFALPLDDGDLYVITVVDTPDVLDFSLLHYFRVGETWHVSSDVQAGTIIDCLEKLSDFLCLNVVLQRRIEK